MSGQHSRPAGTEKTEAAGTRDLEAQFKAAMRRLASGVGLITTVSGGRRFGMTATALCSLSIDPPALAICINQGASMYGHLVARGAFCVNLLREDQSDLCRSFSAAPSEARFGFGSWHEDEDEMPYLRDSQASIFCRVGPAMSFASHTMFVGEVIKIIVDDAIAPLVYLDGRYFAIKPAP
jgi:flavin reductase (DIM6/NTAB) family NADH-FMN oxidoreductase RutF